MQGDSRRATDGSGPEEDAGRIVVDKVAQPTAGGALGGFAQSLDVADFSGSANFTIGIPVTPMRDFQPLVGLSYSSSAGAGPFGLAFTLSLSSIARRTTTRVPRYRDDDEVVLDGELLVPIPDAPERRSIDGVSYRVRRYRPRVEAAFARVERWTAGGDEFWRVIDRDSVISVYGRTDGARIRDSDDPARVFSWLIEDVFDTRGNARVYEYKRENADNVPDVVYERSRARSANVYPERIRYGNATPVSSVDGVLPRPLPDFHGEVVFDYGEYDVRPTADSPYVPVRPWAARPDAFSTYEAGFERRTHRLCRNVLVFHRFAGTMGPDPFLVSAAELGYDESPHLTKLTSLRWTGYRYLPDCPSGSRYDCASLQPLTLSYVPYEPEAAAFTPLRGVDDEHLPPVDEQPLRAFVDLYGDGVPGALYADGATTTYARPWLTGGEAAEIRYLMTDAREFPVPRRAAGGDILLSDLDADGRVDVVSTRPGAAGYYGGGREGRWAGFRSFAVFPTDYDDPLLGRADLTGDGRSDLVRIDDATVSYYAALGRDGFASPASAPAAAGLPRSTVAGEDSSIRFVDVFGTGTQHLVRITDGRIECWPNLGYGRFGKKVELADVPVLGGAFSSDRVFLVDLDGSGPPDFVHVSEDHVDVYGARSGNSFAAVPVRIDLRPGPLRSADRVWFSDVTGTGCEAILIDSPIGSKGTWTCDLVSGRKPHLLERVEDGMGGSTTIEYSSSVRARLEDERDGRPWLTTIPFPLQVVATMTHGDEVTGDGVRTTLRYHHGYYDPDERELRGFGMVERRQESVAGPGRSAPLPPPALTRRWFNTGAFELSGELERAYRNEFFAGDPDEYPMPGPVFEGFATAPGRDLRDAFVGLAGSLVREEVYGLDGTPEERIPYEVSQSNQSVRLVQAASADGPASVLVTAREDVSSTYERTMPPDPRVVHDAVLEVDPFGDPLRSCAVSYRRRVDGPGIVPEQERSFVTATAIDYVPPVDEPDVLLLGLHSSEKNLEILGLDPPDRGLYYSFDTLQQAVAQALAGGTSPVARIDSWRRWVYVGEDGGEAPPEPVTPQALVVRAESAFASAGEIDVLFDGVPVPGGIQSFLADAGGYRLDEATGMWWNEGPTETYLGPEGFFLRAGTSDAFASGGGPRGGTVTTYSYDDHLVAIVEVKDAGSVADVLEHTTRVDLLDYRTLQPARVVTAENVVFETLFDPLGRVVATSHRGTELREGKPLEVGFAPLPLEAPQTWDVPSSLDELLGDPGRFLGGAASIGYVDTAAWGRERHPVASVTVTTDAYPDPASPGSSAGNVSVSLQYADGLGRVAAALATSEPGLGYLTDETGQPIIGPDGRGEVGWTETRWLTAARHVYADESNPARTFAPYYVAGSAFVPATTLPALARPQTRHYDALLRLVRTDYPRGDFDDAFFDSATYGVWEQEAKDTDDTVLESNYYRYFIEEGKGTLPVYERQALLKAAALAGTPSAVVVDALAHAVREVEVLRTDEGDRLLVTTNGYDVTGALLWSADPRLGAAGLRSSETVYSMHGDALVARSADAGRVHMLPDVTGAPTLSFDSRRTLTTTSFDSYHRPTSVVVSCEGAPPTVAQRLVYGDSVDALGATPLADPRIRNVVGSVIVGYDGAGRTECPSRTITGNPLETSQRPREDVTTLADWSSDATTWPALFADLDVTLMDEAFTGTTDWDATGRPLRSTDPADNETRRSYLVSGHLGNMSFTGRDGVEQTILTGLAYDARGRRIEATYGGGDGLVRSTYGYEETTEHVKSIRTVRVADDAALQDLVYWYDPAGNPTHVEDGAAPGQRMFSANQMVTPDLDHTYDSLYRLAAATGRAAAGLTAADQRSASYAPFFERAHPNDLSAVENYACTFTYDDGGNLRELAYRAPTATWTQRIAVAPDSNRGIEVDTSQARRTDALEGYFDAAGNQLKYPGVPALKWTPANQLASAVFVPRADEPGDTVYYAYNGAGIRARRVVAVKVAGGWEREDTFELGGLEIHRRSRDGAVVEEWRRVRVSTDDGVVCEHVDWVEGSPPSGVDAHQVRWQLQDALGSHVTELGDDGGLITYEEYSPYGATVYASGRNLADTSLKRYRHAGKDRDPVTGLYYYGARYYAPWIGRWASPDPAGDVDGLNRYAFVENDPVGAVDVGGLGKVSGMPLGKAKKQAEKDFGRGHREFYKRMTNLTDKARGGDANAIADVKRIANLIETDRYYKKEMAKRVRVAAKKADGAKKGFGLDELLQTSQTGYILLWSAGLLPDKKTSTATFQFDDGTKMEMSLIQIQQWFRNETSGVLWKGGGGHTGAIRPTATSRGYITDDQASAHQARTDVLKTTHYVANIPERVLAKHLQVTANAKDLQKNFNRGFDVYNRSFASGIHKPKMEKWFLRHRDLNKSRLRLFKKVVHRSGSESPVHAPSSPVHDPMESAAFDAEGFDLNNYGTMFTSHWRLQQ